MMRNYTQLSFGWDRFSGVLEGRKVSSLFARKPPSSQKGANDTSDDSFKQPVQAGNFEEEMENNFNVFPVDEGERLNFLFKVPLNNLRNVFILVQRAYTNSTVGAECNPRDWWLLLWLARELSNPLAQRLRQE